jgi:hypothetical protein
MIQTVAYHKSPLSKREIAKRLGVPFKVERRPRRTRSPKRPWPKVAIDDLWDEFDRRAELMRCEEDAIRAICGSERVGNALVKAEGFKRLGDAIKWLRTQIEIRRLETLHSEPNEK